MYFFELVRIVDGKEEVIGGPFVSHAHNFYSSITEAAIAKINYAHTEVIDKSYK